MSGYCKATTFERGWPRKCSNNAVGDHGMCRVHSPEAVARRRVKQDERDKIQAMNIQRQIAKARFASHARTFYDALKKIADGDNDPRALAYFTIEGKAPPTEPAP